MDTELLKYLLFWSAVVLIAFAANYSLFRDAGCRKWGFVSLTLCIFVGLPSTAAIFRFLTAKPAAEIRENVHDIPEEWPAAYMDHGKYKRWYTIKQRPVLFGLSIVGLVVGFVPCYLVTTYAMNDRKYKERGYRPPEEVENSNETDPTH